MSWQVALCSVEVACPASLPSCTMFAVQKRLLSSISEETMPPECLSLLRAMVWQLIGREQRPGTGNDYKARMPESD